MILRTLIVDDFARLPEIDRSESATGLYRMDDGTLAFDAKPVEIAPWTTDDGPRSASALAAFCREHLDAGGDAFVVERDTQLSGIAVAGYAIAPDTAQLAVLYVSRHARRIGVARALIARCYEAARARGARDMYVSATPTDSAVGFYLSEGFAPTKPLPHLLALEPDDIHMSRALS
ncbi:MAG: GNAT family N-acetyltransferase [Planctomycetota bacterium]